LVVHRSTETGLQEGVSTRGLSSKGVLRARPNCLGNLFESADAVSATFRFGRACNRTRTNPCATARKPQLFVVLALLLLAVPTDSRAQAPSSEYQAKAAHLFNFLKFVEWPEDSFADPLAPIVIGVVGEDPFGSALSEMVIGRTVQGRDLVLRKYHVGEDLRGAHLLFIGASERKQLPQILSSLRGSNVLTVADTEGFLEAGGMIQFLNDGEQVRFAINVDAVNGSRLKMSSKLLRLAKFVTGKAKEAGN